MPITAPSKVKKELERAFEIKVEKPVKKLVNAIVRDTYRFITRDSTKVAFQFGSPVLTGQYYTNHTISLNRIDFSTKQAGKAGFIEGEDAPLRPLPLANVDVIMNKWKLGDTVFIANSLDYASDIEKGISTFKAPEGVYRVATELVKVKFREVTTVVGGFN